MLSSIPSSEYRVICSADYNNCHGTREENDFNSPSDLMPKSMKGKAERLLQRIKAHHHHLLLLHVLPLKRPQLTS